MDSLDAYKPGGIKARHSCLHVLLAFGLAPACGGQEKATMDASLGRDAFDAAVDAAQDMNILSDAAPPDSSDAPTEAAPDACYREGGAVIGACCNAEIGCGPPGTLCCFDYACTGCMK
jgi:hypothetical protein